MWWVLHPQGPLASDRDTVEETLPWFPLWNWISYICSLSLLSHYVTAVSWPVSEEDIFPIFEAFSSCLIGATVHSPCSCTVWLPARKLLIQSHSQFNRNCNLKQKSSIYHQLLLLNIDLFFSHPTASQLVVKPSECLSRMTSNPLKLLSQESPDHERLFLTLDYFSQNHI